MGPMLCRCASSTSCSGPWTPSVSPI
jgi:hypothetical protein